MAGNLHISDKLLASKYLYIIIGIVWVMARRHHSSCAVVRHTLVPCGSASFLEAVTSTSGELDNRVLGFRK